jgi:hypothetical protein
VDTSAPTSATVIVTHAMKGAGGATERAERALGLLCNERAAAVGHLYLFAPNGVRLAASRGATPPERLGEFIDQFLGRELAECDAATRIGDDVPSDAASEDRHFTDERGNRYHPFLLRAMIGSEIRYAGVAVFAFDVLPGAPDESLVLAVSTHFIQSGDTPGIEYGGWHARSPAG